MPTSRIIHHVLLGLAVCFLWTDVAAAQEEGAWQPYRDIHLPVAQVIPVEPAQYLVETPAYACPPETVCPPAVVTGNPVYCPPVYCQPGVATPIAAPMYLTPQMTSPVIVPTLGQEIWKWHALPGDLIWHSYLAGVKEPRMSGVAFRDTNGNISLFDVSLGGRASIIRYGTTTVTKNRPEGWELQIEGAGMLRLNFDEEWDFDASDFRFGLPLIYGLDRWQYKFSYYHLSSHLGDEYMERNATLDRINFSRDVLVAAVSFFPRPAWRWYAEMGWAFYTDGGTQPWEFQFGVDYAQPGPTGCKGTPYFAINGHLREEVDFGGNLSTQAGWLWRGPTGHVIRTGVHYFNGKSNQFQFFDQFEQQIGMGLWYDY